MMESTSLGETQDQYSVSVSSSINSLSCVKRDRKLQQRQPPAISGCFIAPRIDKHVKKAVEEPVSLWQRSRIGLTLPMEAIVTSYN